MDMKINEAQLRVYTNLIQQQRPVASPPAGESEPSPVALNSRFADFLSLQEKKFIAQNFKPENSQAAAQNHLGRHIDVRA